MDVSANKIGSGDRGEGGGQGSGGRGGDGGRGDAYVVGVDFGTLSARALVVRVNDGAEAGTAVSEYAHGVIDRQLGGRELPPDWALQDPGDYTEALGVVIPAALRAIRDRALGGGAR
jgi:sugar (pentulose or hexulose) kinase